MRRTKNHSRAGNAPTPCTLEALITVTGWPESRYASSAATLLAPYPSRLRWSPSTGSITGARTAESVCPSERSSAVKEAPAFRSPAGMFSGRRAQSSTAHPRSSSLQATACPITPVPPRRIARRIPAL